MNGKNTFILAYAHTLFSGWIKLAFYFRFFLFSCHGPHWHFGPFLNRIFALCAAVAFIFFSSANSQFAHACQLARSFALFHLMLLIISCIYFAVCRSSASHAVVFPTWIHSMCAVQASTRQYFLKIKFGFYCSVESAFHLFAHTEIYICVYVHIVAMTKSGAQAFEVSGCLFIVFRSLCRLFLFLFDILLQANVCLCIEWIKWKPCL